MNINKIKLLEIIIFSGILMLILIILIGVCNNDMIKAEKLAEYKAKMNLEKMIDISYNEENKLNVPELKENIKENIKNSKIISSEVNELPIYAVVDDYEFKIDENPATKELPNENIKEELGNVINETETTNSVIENSIVENPDIKDPSIEEPIIKENLVKYSNDIKEGMGITITTTEDGIVTIKGKSTDKLFIKISNNIEISNNANDFKEWQKEEGILINKGLHINERIEILEKEASGGQVNMVLRTEKNEAIGILKILEEQTEASLLLDENIIANYIYIDKNVEITSVNLKIKITEVG